MTTPEEMMDVLVALGEAWKKDPTYFGDFIFKVSRMNVKNPFYMTNSEYITAANKFQGN